MNWFIACNKAMCVFKAMYVFKGCVIHLSVCVCVCARVRVYQCCACKATLNCSPQTCAIVLMSVDCSCVRWHVVCVICGICNLVIVLCIVDKVFWRWWVDRFWSIVAILGNLGHRKSMNCWHYSLHCFLCLGGSASVSGVYEREYLCVCVIVSVSTYMHLCASLYVRVCMLAKVCFLGHVCVAAATCMKLFLYCLSFPNRWLKYVEIPNRSQQHHWYTSVCRRLLGIGFQHTAFASDKHIGSHFVRRNCT